MKTVSFDELPLYPVVRWTTPVSRQKFHLPQPAIQGRRSTESDRVKCAVLIHTQYAHSMWHSAENKFHQNSELRW
jgi:hypothetical protein